MIQSNSSVKVKERDSFIAEKQNFIAKQPMFVL